MVTITAVTVSQATTAKRQRNNQSSTSNQGNSSTNSELIARPRKGSRIVVHPQLENNFDENQEENDEYQAAHKFKNGHLILMLAAWAKKPSVEHDLSGVLSTFRERTLGNVDFIEAALLVQAAAQLYAKKVDLLVKSIMESQLRIVKSYNVINVEELQKIEKKMRKRKLTQIDDHQRRSKHLKKRKNWMLQPIFGQFFETILQILQESRTARIKEPDISELYHMEPQYVEPMKVALRSVLKWHDPEYLKSLDEQYEKELAKRFIPLDEYIYRPFLEQSYYVAYESPEKDQIVRWENLLMSDHNFYHEKKFKWYEVFYNKKDPKTMLDITVWEDALYNHRKANPEAEDLCDLLINYDKFDDTACEKFLGDHLKEEYEAQIAAETTKHKTERLCPYQLRIHINTLPEEIMQRHLDRQIANGESHLIGQAASEEATSTTLASSIVEAQENAENLTVSDVEAQENVTVLAPDNPNVENQILLLSQSTQERAESICESSGVPIAIAENSPATMADNDSGVFSESEQCSQNLTTITDDNDAESEINETIVQEVETTGLTAQESRAITVDANRYKSLIKLRERKAKEHHTDDDDEIDKPKRKKRFKLNVTTTANLLDYERFFCSNYNAENREGIVLPLPPLAETPPQETAQTETPQEDTSLEEDLYGEDDTLSPAKETEAEEPESSVPRIPRLPTGEIITPEIRRFMDIEATIAKNREERQWYYDWESTIQTRLKEQQGSKFDIHEYGAKIVNLFPEDEPEKLIKFKDIVKDLPKKEVIWNFVAALHLATSMNLEPSGTTPGMLCNDTLAFKLLNKELHHETLREFAAPSELKSMGAKGKNNKHKIVRNAEPSTYIIEEIVDTSLLFPAEKKQRGCNARDVRVPKSLTRIPKSSKQRNAQYESLTNSHLPTLGTPVVVLNNFNISGLELNANRIKEIQDRLCVREELSTRNREGSSPSVLNDKASNSQNILNQTINNTRKNKESSTSASRQSQSAKTPGKRVVFSEVRCTTTIVKTPSSFLLNTPMATSTPSPRSNHLISCDSGFFTDGGSTPGTSPPNSKVRRLTIEEALFDVDMLMAGPSKDYPDFPATFGAFDDTLSIEDGSTPVKQQGRDKERERVICSRKRQLDFGMGSK